MKNQEHYSAATLPTELPQISVGLSCMQQLQDGVANVNYKSITSLRSSWIPVTSARDQSDARDLKVKQKAFNFQVYYW